MKGYTVKEAAKLLGLSGGQVRHRLNEGDLKGRKVKAPRGVGYEWRVYLNGNEPVEEKKEEEGTDDTRDPMEQIADELVMLGKRLKGAVKEHDDRVRRDTIQELGASLVQNARK
jgi:hypothetical protein